jgi:uncharacterized membrane protein
MILSPLATHHSALTTPLGWITTERDWPWRDGDLLGWPGLIFVVLLLVFLTLWTYSGQRRIGWRRLLGILALRLGALLVIAMLLLRPSFASEETVVTPGRLLIVVDNSLSMKISDSPNSSARWDFVRKLLDWPEIKDALDKLRREKQIDIVMYQGAEDVHKYESAGEANGTRTDIGMWLHSLVRLHRNDRNLRGLVVLSDGADNGTSFPLLDEAAAWRELPCPIQCFGVGSEATKKGQKDIAVVDVRTKPDRVYLKNTVHVEAVVDAPGLENQNVTVRLFVDGKQVGPPKEGVNLPNTRGNVIDAGTFIPEAVGEVKVTVKIDEVPGEFTNLNNEMSTYVFVRKEGITILWAEGRKRLEATFILRQALAKDQRFSITFDERTRDVALNPVQAAYFTTPEKSFDVVVIGDITASRFTGGDDNLLDRIADAVRGRRTGLLMLGGYQTLGNADWPTRGKKLLDLLPVVPQPGQIEERGRVVPELRSHRLLQLGEPAGKDLWGELFGPLDGHTRLGTVRPGGVVLAKYESGEPIFVVTQDTGPRVAVFGGDTTYKAWTRNDDAVRAYERFWTQLIGWLARQEEGNNQLWIKLDKRRLAVGANQKLGFSIGMDGKDGQPIRNARYNVKVIGPGGEQYDVATALKLAEERGAFAHANAVGEYKLIATASATGPDGKELPAGPVSARFLAYAEDVENQYPAANHQELRRLATAGGGEFRVAGKEELLEYLTSLYQGTGAGGWVKRDEWPNWRVAPASDALPEQLGALAQSLTLPCFVLFVGFLCVEWFLRRWWGLV